MKTIEENLVILGNAFRGLWVYNYNGVDKLCVTVQKDVRIYDTQFRDTAVEAMEEAVRLFNRLSSI